MSEPTMTRLSRLFSSSARRAPERLALREPFNGDVTYGTTASIVAEIVTGLRAMGLSNGDRVVFYADSNSPTVYLMLACLTSGIAWVSVSPLFSPEFLADIHTRMGASWVYCEAPASHTLKGTGLKTFGFDRDGAYAQTLPPPVPREGQLGLSAALEVLDEANHPIALDDISFFVTTSGSTGRPKLIAWKEQPYSMGAHLKSSLLSYGCEHYSFLMGSSLSHGFAVNMSQLALDMNATMCMPTSVDVATPLEEVRRFDCNVLAMTPRVLRSLHKQAAELGGGRIFGPSARALLVAGGKPDASIIKQVIAEGIDPIEHYASSEAAVIAATPPGDWREGFAGRLLPDVTVEVAPDSELLVRTPQMMKGYWDSPELTAEAFTPSGQYRTGDLGEVTADGWVRILGRKRDVFGSVEGSAIYPTRIEELLERLPWVDQAILVGNGEAYLSALLVVRDAEVEGAPEDGFLEPTKFATLYEERRKDLVALNRELEHIEQVVRFNLFAKPFDRALYTPVAGAKVRRDRVQIAKVLGARIARLYQPEPDGPSVVR